MIEPRWYYALVWLHGDEVEVHKFTMEPTPEQSHYRAIGSYNAFSERNAKLAFLGRIQGYRVSLRTESEWEIDMQGGDRVYAPEVNPRRQLPMFVHSSIWEFYSAVGYDYRRKKWVRPIPPTSEQLRKATRAFISRTPWTSNDPDIRDVLHCLVTKGMDHVKDDGYVFLRYERGEYCVYWYGVNGIPNGESFTDVYAAIHGYIARCDARDPKQRTGLGRPVFTGDECARGCHN
ncbi:hypothetical protein O152_gp097 [Pseudomonas phage PaBG]|uniref:Uncharacterized protein n=1 Tax=Pseudomonas phage PaBG TaxID=1335230 RepID=S5WKB3_9CAUD|nr:hypothetical protein O152_gp097 [Pseudomonas phage PaBG]AGS81981.1 hypothetical protein PaBG_00097 [Pseudomonas phage PaBG]